MAFGLGRLAVLESKLDIYEDLSKEMLDKLERAVGTISENSNRVAVILERHENRLDESERADKLIIGMLEDMKERHEKDHELVQNRINSIQRKVDANAKFVIGAGAVLATLVAVLQVVPPVFKLLTPQVNAAIIGPANP
jgi:DNA polymerase II small subunit/DNA polymerase delta subunit B